LTSTFKSFGEKNKLFEKLKVEIVGDDFREGLTAIVSVKVPEPQFEGQTKTKFGNNEVAGAVEQIFGEVLEHYLEENPKQAKAYIFDKVVLAATARSAARKAREMVQRKGALSGGGLPGKLADCASKKPR
jgi:DNA gyrase subunit B